MTSRPGPAAWLTAVVARTGAYRGKLRDLAITVIWLSADKAGYYFPRSQVQAAYDTAYPPEEEPSPPGSTP